MPSATSSILKNHIRRLLRNHEGWCIGIAGYDLGHNRRIDDTQISDAMHAQAIVDHGHIVVTH